MGYVLEEISNGVKITAPNLFVSGYIGGGDLPASFYPALLGMHHDAVASNFVYNAKGLLISVTWSSSGSYSVEQIFTYNNTTDQLETIYTHGPALGASSTETFEWSGDNLIGYNIAIINS